MNSFHQLRTTLEEVFSATVHNEEELTYPSATLVLAGLLQVHSRNPRYAAHRARLDSFPHQPVASELPVSSRSRSMAACPSPSELASAGFFHTGSGDEAVCPACGLGLRDWQPSDQPAACHLTFSSAEVQFKLAGKGPSGKPCPAMPCLYLAVHRWLTSELPLARKSLVPVGRVPSVCSLPGVVSQPSSAHFEGEFASLADRLRAIARIMTSPPAPQGWPVENARALGHSDDLIVLALWRLQSEPTGFSSTCPTLSDLRLDPQGTVELLRTILRLQEELDITDLPSFELTASESGDIHSETSDSELSAEDAETAALSRCRRTRIQSPISSINRSSSSHGSDQNICKTINLPHLCEFILWWSQRW